MSRQEPIRSQDYEHALRKTVLWDRRVIDKMPLAGDDATWWDERRADLSELDGGRGAAWRIQAQYAGHARDWVLRHYRRGGMAAKFSKDRYWGVNPDQSRAWREWEVLATLQQAGLPAPKPVAAYFQLSGLRYRAAIVVEMIPQTSTFAQLLTGQNIGRVTWQAVGGCIARFHAAGIYHADLNANNILLNDLGEIYLIDFDRAERRKVHTKWRKQNLQRLQRSLNKLANAASSQAGAFNFAEEDWQALLQGYEQKLTELQS